MNKQFKTYDLRLTTYALRLISLFIIHFLFSVNYSFAQDLSTQAKANILKPPVTITIPITPAQAQGKKCIWYWGRDTIEQTGEITLAPLQTIPLPVLKNNKGEIIKDKDGNPFILGEGGISNFTNFTTDNGLALDAISCGYMDKMGNLWFGTYGGGVSKYDGKSFTSFTTAQGLANNVVRSITEDKSGNLWFGTSGGGVSKYDGKSFTSFTTTQGLANNVVLSITEDKCGNLWFGTDGGGVSCYDGKRASHPCINNSCKHDLRVRQDLEKHNNELAKSFANYTTEQGLANNVVRSITEDKSGNLWFGTEGSGVSRYTPLLKGGQRGVFANYTTEQGLANNVVLSITEDKSGNLWFGTSGGGVSKYDGKSFTSFTTAQGLANNNVWSITEDKTGNLWFGTYGGGVSRYDGKSFTSITTTQGLANNVVLSITEDKSGNLWFGAYGGGVSKYDGKSFTSFTTAQGLANNNVWSITGDKSGNLWFGTSGGVSKYDGKSFTSFTAAQGLSNNNVSSITGDKSGNLWFGTSGGGVSKYDGKSFTNYTTAQGLANNVVWSITEDKMGNLWLGTYGGGVSKYDGKSFTNYTTAQGLANNMVWSITEDKTGNLWFGTYGGGVSRYDGKSFTSFTTAQGLANNNVWSITEDKSGNLWFGTAHGLSCIAAEGSGLSNEKLFTTYTTADGLPDDGVTQIVEYSDKLYIGTNFGICELIPSASSEKGFIVGSTYNSATGYPIKDVNAGQNCMFSDSKGIIWMGTGSDKTGLVRFDPEQVNKNTEPPTVVIQSVKVQEENICWYSLSPVIASGAKQSAANNEIASAAPRNDDSATIAQQEIMTYGKLLSNEMRDSITKKFSDIKFDGITKFYPLPENLVLPYNHNSVSFDFVAIETGRNFLVRYQYALADGKLPSPFGEGQGVGWSPITEKTSATFNNLWEGNYTFVLRARSPERTLSGAEVWSKPITYTFKVLPPWYRHWLAYVFYFLLLASFIFLIVWWNGRKLRERAEELLEKVRIATTEIREQKKHIEEKHKEVTDSINYAQRIQHSILPSLGALHVALRDSFLLYLPKDVVAGDFYWMELKGDTVYFAAADCTGHGVPGAMVSVVCSYALSKTLLEESINETGKLLDRTRELVIERFAKSGEEVKDGMDISLCALNMKTLKLQWSGANNPIWTISKGELTKHKPDKQPIGKHDDPKPFATHNMQLKKDDMLYIFSDGYHDQFGGLRGKRLMRKRMEELIMTNSHKTMDEQKEILQKSFEDWKGGLEQVDDVCIIGVKV